MNKNQEVYYYIEKDARLPFKWQLWMSFFIFHLFILEDKTNAFS